MAAASILQSKDEMMTEIRDRIIYLLNDDLGRIINFEDVYFYPADMLENRNRVIITCIFLNNEGNLCVDMYRSGNDVSANFMCGIAVDSLDERVLKTIIKAFNEAKCRIEDYSCDLYKERNKKLNLLSVFKSVFFQKSA